MRDAFTTAIGRHTLHLGGEFQHYRAAGKINVFGSGTVILVSDFDFADLNGDGVVNDLDIPVAVGIHSTAPVVPVPIPHIINWRSPKTCRPSAVTVRQYAPQH